jgi:hypothetical protein
MGTLDTWTWWGYDNWHYLWGIDEQKEAIFGTQEIKVADAGIANVWYAIAELAELGAFPPNNATVNFENQVQMMLAGKAAIMSIPTDQIGKIVGQPIEKDLVYNWGITFPDSPFDQNQGVKMVGNAFGIGSGAAEDPDKLQAIIDFNKWRYSDEGFAIALKKGFVLPVKAEYKKEEAGPVVSHYIDLLADDCKERDMALWVPFGFYNNEWTCAYDGFLERDWNMILSLINGSMTKADIPVELEKMDAAIAVAIEKWKELHP